MKLKKEKILAAKLKLKLSDNTLLLRKKLKIFNFIFNENLKYLSSNQITDSRKDGHLLFRYFFASDLTQRFLNRVDLVHPNCGEFVVKKDLEIFVLSKSRINIIQSCESHLVHLEALIMRMMLSIKRSNPNFLILCSIQHANT
ncbi:hypothetical protein BpHYR1_025951 [Brachionus plicatilis]|uniref:Uncharacterized protein n=1 Tax=Brachionus plicatilis TaxID=10195 RepID=A0A3M7SM58_BRAPC|nr:hypothetical protein BpHYR1_025951 [Brachionus plicatilis]